MRKIEKQMLHAIRQGKNWRFIKSDGMAEPWQGWRVIEFDQYEARWNA